MKELPELKVVTEGLGGTVYIVSENHDYRDKGKRGYVAEIGVGEGCVAKTSNEALQIASFLVLAYEELRNSKKLEIYTWDGK